MTKTLLVVAAALYDSAGRVLLAQRPPGKAMAGLWEFPGGKIEPGETPEQALVREIHEELRIKINPSKLFPITFASYSYQEFHLLMPLFGLRDWSGQPEPAEGQTLAWVDPMDLHSYPAPAADIPLFDVLIAREAD
ncbi:MAG: (deoxy)nucleoside triphosphate pyrophosphohydrolase [Pseudomonadota bacterium]